MRLGRKKGPARGEGLRHSQTPSRGCPVWSWDGGFSYSKSKIQELSSWTSPPTARAASSIIEQLREMLVHGDKTVAGLWQLLSADAQWGELRQEKRTLDNRLSKHCLEALDWAMQKMNGWGLRGFCPQRKVGALPEGASRYFVTQTCPITTQERHRACVLLPCGNRVFEVPCRVSSEGHQRPTLHLCQDMGTASWHGSVWLVNGLKLRGTLSCDRFHRHQCDLLDAISESGLTLIRLEMLPWLALQRGVYGILGTCLARARLYRFVRFSSSGFRCLALCFQF